MGRYPFPKLLVRGGLRNANKNGGLPRKRELKWGTFNFFVLFGILN